jgi:hypothetical protein
MSSYEELLKGLGVGEEENSAPKFELKDPVTGEARVYNSKEEQQAAVDAMWRTAQSEKEQLLRRMAELGQTQTKPEVKAPVENPYNLSESDLRKLAQLSENSPIEAMDFMFEKSPRYKKLEEELNSLKTNSVQAQGAVNATQFLQKHKDVMLEGPNAAKVQEGVSALVRALVPDGVPTPLHMEMALNNLRVLQPELFTQREQTQQPNDWTQHFNTGATSSRPAPLPSPGRDSGGNSMSLGFEQMVAKLYDEKGPDAAKAFIQRAEAAGMKY